MGWAYLAFALANSAVFALGFVFGVRRMMRELPQKLHAERTFAKAVGLSEGYSQGHRAALREVAHDEGQPEHYRISAAKIGKLCPVCGKTCIHCARLTH